MQVLQQSLFDSQAHVIQVHKYCTIECETFQFALPAGDLFTQENESAAASQFSAGWGFGKIRVLAKSRKPCKLSLFRFHSSAWYLYCYMFPSMLLCLSSESFSNLD